MNTDIAGVHAWIEDTVLPTYLPNAPDKNPMFLEKRVYQGSSGKVYPLPFTDRISEQCVDHAWKTVWLENDYVKVMILPEIGGRIHALFDKTNGYDAIYKQSVIKPALVGLAGPWISGGIEFNWPQHHRPATFLPVEFEIENGDDGSVTVWCGDHDPMARMKGMHGICLRPGQSRVEVKVRAYNRTPIAQTFLWWANIATRVHEQYRSFFPPDVYYVADHAKRAMSEYPLCSGSYYGVDYADRARNGVPESEFPSDFVPPSCKGAAAPNDVSNPAFSYPANDLSWYANIPVPTSYMCMGTRGEFLGGYDFARHAGLVHYANRHISPGKKQWTWGNHEFGYAWDRNLTDTDGPYIELMAGVYTDNQPDFSFLMPGETKSWSQFFYPIQEIGPAICANRDAALSLRAADSALRVGVCVSAEFRDTVVSVEADGRTISQWTTDILPGTPFFGEAEIRNARNLVNLHVRIVSGSGDEIISYSQSRMARGDVPDAATEPPPPEEIESADELFITGVHLEQYRHATRSPEAYWQEALRRDPGDARCNNAMGLSRFRRGEFQEAERHFRVAIDRLTRRNPNPRDGEPFYNLGLCLRYRVDGGEEELAERSYAALYKATWSAAWAGPGYHALAEMDCGSGDWPTALDHIDRSLKFGAENLRARNLKAIILRKLGRSDEADAILTETLRIDPLDVWARLLAGLPNAADMQALLDVAHDFAAAGLYAHARELIESALPDAPKSQSSGADPHDLPTQSWGAGPIALYTLGWIEEKMGRPEAAREAYARARQMPPDYCFPYRLEEIAVLESAMESDPDDPRAPYYLANLLYDRRRHSEAIALWDRSAALDGDFSIVWRNLGIGRFNVAHDPDGAKKAYDSALRANQSDARILFERDQLWKRTGVSPHDRLAELEKRPDIVRSRDDLVVELCALYNLVGKHEQALALLSSRKFQPWEGGEGQVLGQHVRTHLAMGALALASGNAVKARAHFETALTSPPNLGEAKHLLANQSDVHYWLGEACAVLGDSAAATAHRRHASQLKGDFQEMSVRLFSEMTYFSALAMSRLGDDAGARVLLGDLLAYARQLETTEARIAYFATSLPLMLLFDDDLQARRITGARFLQAQAHAGLKDRGTAKRLLNDVLARDPSHAPATDLLRELSSAE